MTPATLKSYTCKDLAQMAKKRGVPGWHSMRKDQLVRALVKVGKKPSSQASRRSPRGKSIAANHRKSSNSNGNGKQTSPHAQRRIRQLQSKLEQIKNLAASSDHRRNGKPVGDRLIVMVRDPYWLHAYWELSRQSVERAQAAMGQHWHGAKPTLRLYKVADDGSATWVRSITIHGGVSNWYVDVQDPPCSFRLEIGYEAGEDIFFCLARSNTVSTPPAGMSDAVDENWKDVAQNADRIFAMSGGYSPQGTSQELQELLEERLQRPMGSPMHTRFGAGADRNLADASDFQLAVDAELIVYGVSRRDAHITLKGEPVRLRSDGSFSVRLSMPDRRQVIPVVASTSDGVEQRTIVLAVERNTKVMEPVVRDSTA